IEILQYRTADTGYGTAEIAKREGRRLAELRRIEVAVQPVFHGTIQFGTFSAAVGPQNVVSGIGSIGGAQRKRLASLEGEDAVHLPAAQEGIDGTAPVRAQRAAPSEGQRVDEAADEPLRDVVGGNGTFIPAVPDILDVRIASEIGNDGEVIDQ